MKNDDTNNGVFEWDPGLRLNLSQPLTQETLNLIRCIDSCGGIAALFKSVEIIGNNLVLKSEEEENALIPFEEGQDKKAIQTFEKFLNICLSEQIRQIVVTTFTIWASALGLRIQWAEEVPPKIILPALNHYLHLCANND